MLGNNQELRNRKPRDLAVTKPQGGTMKKQYGNSTMFGNGKSRYEKAMELYKSGKVSIGSNGLFKVSGYYDVDTERMTCTCPDYKTRKEPCKHLFAAMLFVKNRGKDKIGHLEGQSWVDEMMNAPDKLQESNSKPFDRQSTITRLAVLNTATEILKTHRKPLEFNDIVSLASQLEKWALGE